MYQGEVILTSWCCLMIVKFNSKTGSQKEFSFLTQLARFALKFLRSAQNGIGQSKNAEICAELKKLQKGHSKKGLTKK
jgi:hypothetical protein